MPRTTIAPPAGAVPAFRDLRLVVYNETTPASIDGGAHRKDAKSGLVEQIAELTPACV